MNKNLTIMFASLLVFILLSGSAMAACSITVTSPNGGETWNGKQNITWTNSGGSSCGSTFDISYSSNNGTTYSTLATVSKTPAKYSWNTALSTDSTLAKIKICEHGSTTACDSSNAKFTVNNNAVPEFGTIAAIVAVVGLLTAVLVLRKK